jgi:uncharacterized protein YabE (DUF348 family)
MHDVWIRVTSSIDSRDITSDSSSQHHTSRKRRRLPLVAALTAAAIVAGGGAVAYGEARKTVTLDVDGDVRTVSTFAGSVGGLLTSNGVQVDQRDLVAPGADARLSDGDQVVVRYGRELALEIDGKQTEAWVTALDADEALEALDGRGGDVRIMASRSGDRAAVPIRVDAEGPVAVVVGKKTTVVPEGGTEVNAILAAAEVEIDGDDRVSVLDAVDAGLKGADAPDVALQVERVTTKKVTKKVALPYETRTRTSDARYEDLAARVAQEGREGVRTVVHKVTTVDGKVESRTKISDDVTRRPVPEVLVEGTKERPEPSAPASFSGSTRSIGQQMAAARGWTGEQWTCLEALWTRESGWNHLAQNPSSGAYGIPQALPGSKMSTAGSDWATNPATQIEWGLDYIAGRYGTPCGAWGHSQSVGWY